ncbi:MAG: hypothetical protein J0M07_21695 [Anaerolineae bacterium]|nr:hypothetical protein [Anaerolineae bacterium]
MQGPPANANHGPFPDPAIAREQVVAYFQQHLKDPDSMKALLIAHPVRDCYFRGLVNGGGHFCGHRICVSVNAKNSYGAYTGAEVYVFWFWGNSPSGGVFPNGGACPAWIAPGEDWRASAPTSEAVQ